MPLLDLDKFQILKFVHKFIHHHDQLPSVYSHNFILTTHILKMFSIPSLLELLVGKYLSHIKMLSFGTLSLKN